MRTRDGFDLPEDRRRYKPLVEAVPCGPRHLAVGVDVGCRTVGIAEGIGAHITAVRKKAPSRMAAR
jgi:hypothetical protein